MTAKTRNNFFPRLRLVRSTATPSATNRLLRPWRARRSVRETCGFAHLGGGCAQRRPYCVRSQAIQTRRHHHRRTISSRRYVWLRTAADRQPSESEYLCVKLLAALGVKRRAGRIWRTPPKRKALQRRQRQEPTLLHREHRAQYALQTAEIAASARR